MKELLSEINLGTEICKKLKNIYYPDEKWGDCYKQVALKFTALKIQSRKFYKDKSELEILMELRTYNDHDLKEMLESE